MLGRLCAMRHTAQTRDLGIFAPDRRVLHPNRRGLNRPPSRTYMHTYMHTYIHTYIHTYMHTYIHLPVVRQSVGGAEPIGRGVNWAGNVVGADTGYHSIVILDSVGGGVAGGLWAGEQRRRRFLLPQLAAMGVASTCLVHASHLLRVTRGSVPLTNSWAVRICIGDMLQLSVHNVFCRLLQCT